MFDSQDQYDLFEDFSEEIWVAEEGEGQENSEQDEDLLHSARDEDEILLTDEHYSPFELDL